jgi:hypothetical protein
VGTKLGCSPGWKTDDDVRNRPGTLCGGRLESASGGGVPAARRRNLPAAARRGKARLPRPAGRCDRVWRARRLGVVRRRWALCRAAALGSAQGSSAASARHKAARTALKGRGTRGPLGAHAKKPAEAAPWPCPPWTPATAGAWA